jgi:DNA mismatch repair protein MutS
MALIKDYFEKTKNYIEEYGENTILLMQVGAFFEVYGMQNQTTRNITGSKIFDFSIVCDLNIADKKICVGKEDIIMAGFSTYMIDKYLKKLQNAGFTVIVFTQDEQAKNTSRSLEGIYSPGTYFSDSNTQITNNIMCVWIHVSNKFKSKDKEVHVGIANIDIFTGKSTIFQFNELYLINSPTTFDELERFVSIYNPSEIILIGNISIKEINSIISYSNIQSKSIHKISMNDSEIKQTDLVKRACNCEKQTYQKAVLEKFFKIKDFDVFSQNFYENSIATQSFCYVLDFIYQHNPNLVNKLEEPLFDNCSERLVLANHSLKQLNIIDDGSYNGKLSSVEKLLNQCITPMGKRHFSHMLLNPTTNITHLNEEYNMTEHILKKYKPVEIDSLVKNRLTTIKDISKINRQIIMKKISPQTIYQFNNSLKIIKDMYIQLSKDPILLTYFKNKLNKKDDVCSKIITNCDNILDFLNANFVLDLCKDIDTTQTFESNFIKPKVDSELDDKTNLLFISSNKLETIRKYLNENIIKYEKKTSKKGSSDFVKLHETEKNNFSLIATKRRCSILKEMFNKSNFLNEEEKSIGISLSYTSNEETNDASTFRIKIFENLFFTQQTSSNDGITNPDISSLCSDMSSVKIQLKDLITNVYIKILNKMDLFQKDIHTIIEIVTIIDVIFTKANIARLYNYCKPEIVNNTEKSFINAKGLRHCLIEHLQQNELYVTNDIELGNNITNGVLLYGTNAVGKTSLIRALGITTIMAQSGLFVPCSSLVFSPYKYIFTRILGNDNMFKNMSTFAVEMYELRTILRLANERSLVLGDELCSGTESVSATSIFVAGIKHLHDKKSSFIFATHLHEIVNYEEIVELNTVVLKHMAVIYDKEKDLLIYDRKIKDGSGDNMYGLEVCKSLNLPVDFIEYANNIRMKYHPSSASILSLKTSHFNSKKIVGLCEMCNVELGKEVHHLQHQQFANENGFIQTRSETFHKNHSANLLTLCEKCHDKIHKDKKMHKKVKTSKGVVIANLSINI